MTVSQFKQFSLLFRKNWLIQKRNVCCTVIEILLPTVITLLFLFIRSLVDITNEDLTIFSPFSALPIISKPQQAYDSLPDGTPWLLGFTPNNTITQEIMTLLAAILTIPRIGVNWDIRGYDKESVMVNDLIKDSPDGLRSMGGVVFLNDFPQNASIQNLPAVFDYKLRMASVSVSYVFHFSLFFLKLFSTKNKLTENLS